MECSGIYSFAEDNNTALFMHFVFLYLYSVSGVNRTYRCIIIGLGYLLPNAVEFHSAAVQKYQHVVAAFCDGLLLHDHGHALQKNNLS